MFFRRWRESLERRYLANAMIEYTGRDALVARLKPQGAISEDRQRLGEVGLIWVVAHLRNYKALAAQLRLRDFADVMNKFYAAVADAILPAEGDINCFAGASVV